MAGNSRNVGTLRKVKIDGIAIDMKFDADMTMMLSKWAVEPMPTTGGLMYKYTLQAQSKTVDAIANGEARAKLIAFSEEQEDHEFIVVEASGDEYHAQGRISLGEGTTAEGKIPVTFIAEEWARIPA